VLTDLVLHIGLPKTATTTLQEHVFPALPRFIGAFAGDGPSAEDRLLEDVWRPLEAAWLTGRADWPDEVRRTLARIDALRAPSVILSCENLSHWPLPGTDHGSPFMDNWSRWRRVRPHPVVPLLAEVRDQAGPDVRLRVILTLRNQADFMGSHYAQAQGRMSSPGQEDFEAKVAGLLVGPDPFLQFDALVEELQGVVGTDRCLLLIHEDGPIANAGRIVAFLGLPTALVPESLPSENRRQVAQRSWQGSAGVVEATRRGGLGRVRRAIARRRIPAPLRVASKGLLARVDDVLGRVVPARDRPGEVVTIPDELAERIRVTFAASNERLAQRIGRPWAELQRLGY
jgi:hypothetical protein